VVLDIKVGSKLGMGLDRRLDTVGVLNIKLGIKLGIKLESKLGSRLGTGLERRLDRRHCTVVVLDIKVVSKLGT
jgi:hypothetical protein